MWSLLLGPAGAVAVLVIVGLMVYTDRLVPYRSHIRQLTDKQTQIDYYQAAAKAHEARADDLQKQLVHILSAVKTTAGAS